MGLKSNKTTSTVSYPDFVSNLQEGMLTAAGGMVAPYLQGSSYGIAGQTADQQKAAELARQSAMGAFNTDYSSKLAGAGGGYQVATVGGGDIKSLMNPYLDSVGASTLANMRRERDATDAQIGARNASGVAFGGSGSALERAQLNRGYGEQVGSTINSLLSQGYDRASQLALANAQAQNSARQYNSGIGLQALQAADSAANNTYNRQQGALQTLLGIGNQNQQYMQSVLDLPRENINWLASLLPPVGATTTQKTPTNPLSTILGIASLPLKGTLGGSVLGM